VQAHKGELKIESEVNRGTTVRIRLPASPVKTRQQTILFLCTGNSCRSQMAEGFARRLAGDSYRVFSAGTAPKEIHPLTVRVMQEAGINITCQYSKNLTDVPLDTVDQIVTLCGESDEHCPTLRSPVQRTHWPLADPALARGNEAEILEVFRSVRDEIRARVENFFSIEVR
jgi:arsenate reductase